MYDKSAKSLRWLANQFPAVETPKDDTDRISACIHLYCTAGADAIEALTAELAALQSENTEKDREIERLKDEPLAYKFYYCESEDSYLLGRRLDTLYYARCHKSGFVWEMSRFLPWGQTIEAQDTAWKKHTYPSEPVEISPDEWFAGFLRQRFSRMKAERDKLLDRAHEAQVERDCARAERDAAIADISHVCPTCGQFQGGDCPVLFYKDYPKDCEHWRWRGVQGEG